MEISSLEGVEKKGWLRKQGGRTKGLKKRYCVLLKSNFTFELRYYAAMTDKKVAGVITLDPNENYVREADAMAKGIKLDVGEKAFEICSSEVKVNMHHESFVFVCYRKSEYESWMNALKKHLQSVKKERIVHTLVSTNRRGVAVPESPNKTGYDFDSSIFLHIPDFQKFALKSKDPDFEHVQRLGISVPHPPPTPNPAKMEGYKPPSKRARNTSSSNLTSTDDSMLGNSVSEERKEELLRPRTMEIGKENLKGMPPPSYFHDFTPVTKKKKDVNTPPIARKKKTVAVVKTVKKKVAVVKTVKKGVVQKTKQQQGATPPLFSEDISTAIKSSQERKMHPKKKQIVIVKKVKVKKKIQAPMPVRLEVSVHDNTPVAARAKSARRPPPTPTSSDVAITGKSKSQKKTVVSASSPRGEETHDLVLHAITSTSTGTLSTKKKRSAPPPPISISRPGGPKKITSKTKATPKLTLTSIPKTTPKVTPETTPKGTPKTSPKVTPKTTPKTTPKDTPKATPKTPPSMKKKHTGQKSRPDSVPSLSKLDIVLNTPMSPKKKQSRPYSSVITSPLSPHHGSRETKPMIEKITPKKKSIGVHPQSRFVGASKLPKKKSMPIKKKELARATRSQGNISLSPLEVMLSKKIAVKKKKVTVKVKKAGAVEISKKLQILYDSRV